MGDHETPGDGAGPEEELSAEALEAGRRLFAGPCDFIAGAKDARALPPPSAPEIAFAGRSNVGKSSLINALTGRKALARTSRTPGRTQQINFFALGPLLLVDLPGYGHAKVAKTVVADWTETMRLYLKGRATLRRVLLLVDSRHGLKPSDIAIMDELDKAAVSYQVVLTKADEPGPAASAAMAARVSEAIKRRPAAHPVVQPTSAEKGQGIPELRARLALLAAESVLQ
jgi:GTP-binding protein